MLMSRKDGVDGIGGIHTSVSSSYPRSQSRDLRGIAPSIFAQRGMDAVLQPATRGTDAVRPEPLQFDCTIPGFHPEPITSTS